MPGKKKITREAIVRTAVEILRAEGIEGVNTRKIAKRLGCSTQPIYSEFENMEQLKQQLKKEAEKCYVQKVAHYTSKSDKSAYMAYGLGFIKFARDEKQLFRHLFMCDRHGVGQTIEDINAPAIMQVLTDQYGFPKETALRFHHDMAIYSYGLAVMLNTNYMDMDEDSIKQRLRMEFVALSAAHGLAISGDLDE